MTRITPLGTPAAVLALAASALGTTVPAGAQEPQVDTALYSTMEWRLIGPFRGGRSVAVAGVNGQSGTYYFGGVGGGVWKTEDAGVRWANVSDGFLRTASVGALAVAPSDPNVVYVGMGEHAPRGVTTSHGDGVYRSTDAGATWTHLGLESTRAVSRIVVHPTDPDRVFVAAQGPPYGPAEQRGIFRSHDGGTTWERVLFVNETAGASDLSMDPSNPRILYARVLGPPTRPVGCALWRAGKRNLEEHRRRRHVDPLDPGSPRSDGEGRGERFRCRSEPGLRHDRSGARWGSVPVGRRRTVVDAGERHPRAQVPAVVLHRGVRRSAGREHGVRPQRAVLEVHRRRPHVPIDSGGTRRQPTTCGSTRRTIAT